MFENSICMIRLWPVGKMSQKSKLKSQKHEKHSLLHVFDFLILTFDLFLTGSCQSFSTAYKISSRSSHLTISPSLNSSKRSLSCFSMISYRPSPTTAAETDL